MHEREEDAETQLDGVIDAQGSIIGEVVQNGIRGGRFILEPAAGASPAPAPRPQTSAARVATPTPGLRLASRDFGATSAASQAALPALLTSGGCAGGPQTCGASFVPAGLSPAAHTAAKGSSHRAPSCMDSPSSTKGHAPPGPTSSYSPAPVQHGTQVAGHSPAQHHNNHNHHHQQQPSGKRIPRHSWPGIPPGQSAAPAATAATRGSPRVARAPPQPQPPAHVQPGHNHILLHQHLVAH